MKKILALCLILFSVIALNAQKQLFIQDISSNKMYEIKTGDKIRYSLLSDSTLGLGYENVEHEKIHWINEDRIIFENGEEVLFTDIKTLYRFSPFHAGLRKISLPVLTVGLPFLFQGTTKLSLEGLERDNKEYVPLAFGGGLALSLIGILPYAVGPASFDMTNENYELITM